MAQAPTLEKVEVLIEFDNAAKEANLLGMDGGGDPINIVVARTIPNTLVIPEHFVP